MKKYLALIVLTIVLLIPFLFLQDFINPLIETITKGMSSKERGRVTAFIICVPIIACYFLIDLIKRKWWDKDK